MATAPEAEEQEPTPVQRVRTAIAAPASDKNRPVTLLAISAGLSSMAPEPWGAIAVALTVIAAVELLRRR